MAIWLIRAGSQGRYQEKFLLENRIYLTLHGMSVNLAILPERDGVAKAVDRICPHAGPERNAALVQQLWPFAHQMSAGDLVLLLLAGEPSVIIGQVKGDYRFEHAAADPLYHWRAVSWISGAVPRSHFGPDLLLSFASRAVFCRVRRNNIEQRLAAMQANDWGPEPAVIADENSDETTGGIDLEAAVQDQLARHIAGTVRKMGLPALVGGLLQARGFTSCRPAGGSTVFFVGAGPLGFGKPRLCVQAEMNDAPAGRKAIDELLAAAEAFGAQEVLFVSWSGFQDSAPRQAPDIYRLRLWSRKELLDELCACYGLLDQDLKNRLGLKTIWISGALPN